MANISSSCQRRDLPSKGRTGILHKFPIRLAGQRFDKEPGPPLQVATVLERPGPGCLVVPEALALHPPPPDAHGAGTGRTCVPEPGGEAGEAGRAACPCALTWPPFECVSGPGSPTSSRGGWESGHLAAAARNSGRRARPSGGPGWEGAAAAQGPRGSDGGGRSDGAENGAGRGGVGREVLILIVSV